MLLQLLLLMVLLIIIGEPLRFLLSRSFNSFKNLDFIQSCVIDVYLAGLILYAIALIPLHLFTTAIVLGITVLSGILSIFLHRNLLKKTRNWLIIIRRPIIIRDFLSEHKVAILKSTMVFGMFLLSLWIQLAPLSSFIFGSIHDTTLHALFVEIILENGHIPATHQPYLTAAIIYPQGAHVIFAYAYYIMGMIPPIAVFYVSPLFNSMTTLAAYYLGRRVNPTKNLDIIFAFIITFVSMWPTYITWGSNPFIIGFPYYLICLGFVPFLYDSSNLKVAEIFVIGILYGYLASIHLAFYEVIIVSAFLWGLFKCFHKFERLHGIITFLALCIFSVIPIVSFLYRFIKYYPYPGHNIGLPDDMVADPTSPPSPRGQPSQSPILQIITKFPEWLALNYNIHPDLILRIALISFVFIALFIFSYSFKKKRDVLVLEKIAITSLVAGILLNFGTYIFPVILWSRIGFIIYVSACLLISSFTIRFYQLINSIMVRIFQKVTQNNKKAIIGSSMAAIVIFSLIYGPFVYHTVFRRSGSLRVLYGIYAITSESDYELMTWMKNLPENATVLISPYESGGFIPSVSQRKIVFPFTAYLLSASYRRLINLIQQEMINKTTYELLNKFEISHIFIGSDSVYQWGNIPCSEDPKWDPLLFLGNPNFKLIKKIGDSYLFAVSSNPNPTFVFQEDFENFTLNQMEWNIGQLGHGNYNLSLRHHVNGNRFLEIEGIKASSRLLYAVWMDRKIYLPKTSDVFLSFNLNASQTVPPNTVSISISNPNYSQSISFVTPSPIYGNQSNIIILQDTQGFFNFNLSELWMEKLNATLPRKLIIEITLINLDVNSPTLMTIDDITFVVHNSED